MRHMRSRPHAHRQQITGAGADPIDQTAEEKEPDPVGRLEPEDDVAIAALGPAIEFLQRRLEDAEYQPVDVAEDDGSEEQTADDPS